MNANRGEFETFIFLLLPPLLAFDSALVSAGTVFVVKKNFPELTSGAAR